MIKRICHIVTTFSAIISFIGVANLYIQISNYEKERDGQNFYKVDTLQYAETQLHLLREISELRETMSLLQSDTFKKLLENTERERNIIADVTTLSKSVGNIQNEFQNIYKFIDNWEKQRELWLKESKAILEYNNVIEKRNNVKLKNKSNEK